MSINFGFCKKKSWYFDAIYCLNSLISDCPSNYILVIFIYISGAFDNLFTISNVTPPMFLMNCLVPLVAISPDRRVNIKSNYSSARKVHSKGFHLKLYSWWAQIHNFKLFAYAVNSSTIIKADNRRDLKVLGKTLCATSTLPINC